MRRNANAVTLFEDRSVATFEEKLRAFGREIGKRHRGRPADHGAVVTAVRGYYRMWSLFAPLPALDDRALAFVLSEYDFVRTGRRVRAA